MMGAHEHVQSRILDHETALDRITAAVARREPFSMLRVGDGEAVALSVDDDAWLHDIEYLQSHWGSQRVKLGDVLRVRDGLQAALRTADMVGVREDVLGVVAPDDLLDRPMREIADYVREHFPLREEERAILTESAARRLALVHRVVNRFAWSPEQEFCSSWIHWELLASGVVNELLHQVPEVVLVTSRPELGPVVAERFDVRAHVVEVPDKFVDTGNHGGHVPDRYDAIRDELQYAAGTLALVGAGIPGKVYCHWLKEAGCIAIDVGSVLDAWVGKPSRPIVLRDRFGVLDGRTVPEELRLVEPDPEASEPEPTPTMPRRQMMEARARSKEAARRLAVARKRLARTQRARAKAVRQRDRAIRQRDAARRELEALRGRWPVRALLALSRWLRGGS